MTLWFHLTTTHPIHLRKVKITPTALRGLELGSVTRCSKDKAKAANVEKRNVTYSIRYAIVVQQSHRMVVIFNA